MQALLFLPRLDLHSGTAQLLRMQALGLRAQGVATTVACERGALRFFLQTGVRTRYASAAAVGSRATCAAALIVDHGMAIPEADVVFVHNLETEVNRFLAAGDAKRAIREREFFRRLNATTPIVANSELVRAALIERFALQPERIVVHRPGYQAARFSAEHRPRLRARARRELGIDESTPLFGFVTSGNFRKRGLDVFLATAEKIAVAMPEARFLIVGARRLPTEAAAHPLVVQGSAFYRPKNHSPERWIAALDLFVYAALFEEFGMVVLEALALGVPVLTSRRVGAAECLPPEYAAWIGDEPNADELAARAMTLIEDDAARARLAAAGVASSRAGDDRHYGAATAAAIMAQKRRLK